MVWTWAILSRRSNICTSLLTTQLHSSAGSDPILDFKWWASIIYDCHFLGVSCFSFPKLYIVIQHVWLPRGIHPQLRDVCAVAQPLGILFMEDTCIYMVTIIVWVYMLSSNLYIKLHVVYRLKRYRYLLTWKLVVITAVDLKPVLRMSEKLFNDRLNMTLSTAFSWLGGRASITWSRWSDFFLN